MSKPHKEPRVWRVNWQSMGTGDFAWFQATRRNGSAPREGQEVVAAEDYDSLEEQLVAERQFADKFQDELAELKEQLEALPRIKLLLLQNDVQAALALLEHVDARDGIGAVSSPASRPEVSERGNATGAPPQGQSSEVVATGTRRPRPANPRSETSDPASRPESA